jgi:hypothetical protein
MMVGSTASIVGTSLGTVATILGAALITAAWAGEAPKRSGVGFGLGMVALGATLTALARDR